MQIRVSGHTAYRTEYHRIWIPKARRRILNPGVREYLSKLFPKVLRSLPGCEVVRLNIQADVPPPGDEHPAPVRRERGGRTAEGPDRQLAAETV